MTKLIVIFVYLMSCAGDRSSQSTDIFIAKIDTTTVNYNQFNGIGVIVEHYLNDDRHLGSIGAIEQSSLGWKTHSWCHVVNLSQSSQSN